MRSIWKASYDIFNTSGQQVLKIHEENAWVKVMDALVGELPVVGMFTGYLFNPAYLIERMDGTVLMRLAKQPAFLKVNSNFLRRHRRLRRRKLWQCSAR